MKNTQRLGASLILLALLAFAVKAEAQTSTGASLKLDAEVDIDTDSIILENSATGSADASTEEDAETGASSINYFNTLNGNDMGTNTPEIFTLTRDDIAATTTVSVDPADVASKDDFSAYARSVMALDENVMKIESDGGSVSVWYKEPGKVLGVIPVAVTAKATVTRDGAVVVEYPWWYDVFAKDEDIAEFQTTLSTTAGTIARAGEEIEFSSNLQARLVNALRTGMKEHYDVTASSSTSTDIMAE